ncbi:MAG: hypothetical protein RIS36_2309 [Pseudomonadota bacterium]
MRPSNLYFIPNRDVRPATLMPYASLQPGHPDLQVTFAQNTFDAEGREARGPFFSRVMHWPGGTSGVTIGRGYDMGQRTRLQIISELRHAGLTLEDATFFGDAAGLRGTRAENFVKKRMIESPVISITAQRALFEKITTPEIIADVKRIFSRHDVGATYGSARWETLSDYAKEIVFDLRYRGDYTPTTRKVIQPLLVRGDDDGLRAVMRDSGYWANLNVPAERVRARANVGVESPRYWKVG